MVAFFIVAVVYIALWLALAMLLSVVTRRAATAAGRNRDLARLHPVRRIRSPDWWPSAPSAGRQSDKPRMC